MNELIQQARELCEKATPGPWKIGRKSPSGAQNVGTLNGALTAQTTSESNAAFIAHAREDIPYLLARLEKAEAENRWIPVSERLPENGIDVLLYWSNDAQNEKYVDMERYHIDHWETLDRPWIRAIAWMPLPEPPKGE